MFCEILSQYPHPDLLRQLAEEGAKPFPFGGNWKGGKKYEKNHI
jgi:hypothetical protein